MKKTVLIALLGASTLGLAACNNTSDEPAPAPSPTEATTPTPEPTATDEERGNPIDHGALVEPHDAEAPQ